MKKINKNESGFSTIEALLIILILVVIGAVGYMVYHNNHKTSTTSTSTTAAKTSSTSNSSKSTVATNPYAGWQQLCSSGGGLCMKYPVDWKLSGSDSAGYTITSPSGTTAIVYLPNGSEDGGAYTQDNVGNCPSNILSVTPLTTNANDLDTVQAITNCTANVNSNATSSSPSYSIVSASEVQSQSLKAGMTDNNALNITINSKSNSTRQLLYISDLSNTTYGTYSSAQQWFSSTDLQTAAKILSSVSYVN
jgi:hypothetical protein